MDDVLSKWNIQNSRTTWSIPKLNPNASNPLRDSLHATPGMRWVCGGRISRVSSEEDKIQVSVLSIAAMCEEGPLAWTDARTHKRALV
jgi:hypothetical protein